jgi:hypothetical protein
MKEKKSRRNKLQNQKKKISLAAVSVSSGYIQDCPYVCGFLYNFTL